MSTVFAKLNLKDHKQIVVLDSPSSFESELAALKGVEIIRDLKKAKEVTFSLAFVTTQGQVDALAPAIARKAAGDAIVWFAYPKGTSKKYKSEIDRDHVPRSIDLLSAARRDRPRLRTGVREVKANISLLTSRRNEGNLPRTPRITSRAHHWSVVTIPRGYTQHPRKFYRSRSKTLSIQPESSMKQTEATATRIAAQMAYALFASDACTNRS
jgi:hypothetical protein